MAAVSYKGRVRRRWFVSPPVIAVPVIGTVLMGGAGSAGNEPLLAVGAGVIVLFALASVVFSRAVQDGRVDD